MMKWVPHHGATAHAPGHDGICAYTPAQTFDLQMVIMVIATRMALLPMSRGKQRDTLQRRFSRRQIGSQFHPCRAAFLKAYGWFVFRFVRTFPGREPGTRHAYFGDSPAHSA